MSERTLTAAEAHDVRLGLYRPGDPAAVEPEVEAALAADPGDVRALVFRGERTPAEAAALARRAVEAHPESPLAWAFLARSGFPPGDHAGRVDALRKAVALDPEHPVRELELSRELLALGRYSEALGLAERAGRAAPFSPNAPYLAAWSLAGLGRCAEASASAERAASLASALEERDFPSGAELARMQRTCAEHAKAR